MKMKVTKKSVLNAFGNVYGIPYCDCYQLFRSLDCHMYTAGIYGWNCDIYTVNGVAITTGYRCFGRSINSGVMKKYEKRFQNLKNKNAMKATEYFEKMIAESESINQ